MKVPKANTGSITKMENGTYPSRVVSIIDLGTREVEGFNGEQKLVREVEFTFEFPTEILEYEKDGEKIKAPFIVFKRVGLSGHPKSNLAKLAKAAGFEVDEKTGLSEDFDVMDLLDKTMLATVGKTSGGNDKITEFTQLPKGMEVGERYSPLKKLDLENFDSEVFNELPDWKKEEIQATPEYKENVGESGIDADEIGF